MLFSFLLALAFMGDPGSLNPYSSVSAIPVPPGYHRTESNPSYFASWLRKLPLKKDRTVHLYDGSLKRNQDAQFAVLDISVGHRDLQQCADAVMRLRAEDAKGHRIFLLAQSYMPAQDIHIVKNPLAATLSPWFRAETAEENLSTPEWIFKINELRAWSR